MCSQLKILTLRGFVLLMKEPNGEGLRTLPKGSGSCTSDSPKCLLNSFKKPCNSGLRPKRDFSIPCQYTVSQCSDLMLLSEWGSHDIYLPWLTKREEKSPACKCIEYSLGCKEAVHQQYICVHCTIAPFTPTLHIQGFTITRSLFLAQHCLHKECTSFRTWRILLIKEKVNRRNTKRRHTKHTLSHWSHVSVSRFGKRAAMVSIASEYLQKKPKQYI